LVNAGLHPKIVGWDFDWDNTEYAQTLLSDPTTNRALAGIAWHCYGGDPSSMAQIHDQYPTKAMYETECATGSMIAPPTTIRLLMDSVQNWASTIELWNITLDPNDGPHTGGCTDCPGVVTIDPTTGDATYTNDYYQVGHFSKFVAPGAYHIGGDIISNGLHGVGFANPDGSKVVVVSNIGGRSTTFTVRQDGSTSFTYTLPADATVTFTWS
jgi:glucosylceramidase